MARTNISVLLRMNRAGNAPDWTPIKLGAALRGWYKADVGVTGNPNVTVWADQSGNGHTLVNNVSPTYDATGLNGKEAIIFSAATGSQLSTSAGAFALGSTSAISVFALATMTTTTDANGRLISYLGNGQAADYDNVASSPVIQRDSTSNAFSSFRNSATICSQNISLATVYRFGIIYDGANATPYLNGVAGTPGASSGTFTSPGRILVGINSGSAWSGAVREIIVTNTALSSGDRISVDTYLAGRS